MAARALALATDLAVAYLARGRPLWTPANHFPHEKAIREYRRAPASDPSLDEARNRLALIYCHIGLFDQAIEESREAVPTNPNNNLAVYRTAQAVAFRGQCFESDRNLDSLRQDAGFIKFMAQLRQQWVAYKTLFRLASSARMERWHPRLRISLWARHWRCRRLNPGPSAGYCGRGRFRSRPVCWRWRPIWIHTRCGSSTYRIEASGAIAASFTRRFFCCYFAVRWRPLRRAGMAGGHGSG